MTLTRGTSERRQHHPGHGQREALRALVSQSHLGRVDGFLAALFGLPMNEDQLNVYRECTGRTEPPGGPFKGGWLVCGRRSGKSFVLALVAVFLACFQELSEFLAPGERATILILAADRKQSRVIFRFVSALLKEVPIAGRIDRG